MKRGWMYIVEAGDMRMVMMTISPVARETLEDDLNQNSKGFYRVLSVIETTYDETLRWLTVLPDFHEPPDLLP